MSELLETQNPSDPVGYHSAGKHHGAAAKTYHLALRTLIGASLSAMALSAPVLASDSLTIYSKAQPGAISPQMYRPAPGGAAPHWSNIPGYAVIRHGRTAQLQRGRNQLAVTDVAALIDPTTVTFKSLTAPKTQVLEQNYQYDLVSSQKLLERFLGQTITVEQVQGDNVKTITGELLGLNGGLILKRSDNRITTVGQYHNIQFPELPGGLMTKPTLLWDLNTSKAGNHDYEISYQTDGITWWSDYNAIYSDAGQCELDLSAWVSIINQSGASYEDAKLKLVAGEVNRVQPGRMVAKTRRNELYSMADEAEAAGFEEKSFFEYHLYTLGRNVDLPDRSTKQIELFPAVSSIDCQKELVFDATSQLYGYGSANYDQNYGRSTQADINVFLRFKNDKKSSLGVPLPAGRIRVNQLDEADGSLEFIGEDIIDHTPKNEKVLIKLGNSFDVVGERTQTNFTVNSKARKMWETIEVTLRNRKDEATEVIVRERLYRWTNWEIEESSMPFEKENSNHIQFKVKLKPDEEKKVSYQVYYSW